jgi:hypothetical protein
VSIDIGSYNLSTTQALIRSALIELDLKANPALSRSILLSVSASFKPMMNLKTVSIVG